MSAAEGRQVDALISRCEELAAADAREAAASAHRLESGTTIDTPAGSPYGSGATVRGEQVYRPDREHSFFRDMRAARLGDWSAAERLQRNQSANGREVRAGDMSTTAGTGGQFAPPAWLVDEWVVLARAGRVAADLMTHDVLPAGVSSINLPKISTGAAVGVQTTQNTAITDVAMTTTTVTSGITTIAGKQVVSQQLLNQSGVPFDRVILGDLAADYARQLDLQVIAGTGTGGQLRGLLNGAGVGSTAYTTATPKVVDGTTPANSFYGALVRAINTISTTRFLPPTAIVMHPSRWAWVMEALDGSSRPLILATGGAFNSPGSGSSPLAQGQAGVLLGLPVYTDPNIPTNLGAGTNQDPVIVMRAPDAFLWESNLALESFDSTYADQLSVLFRASAYSAFIPDRFGPSVNVILGTGLVAPVL